MPPLCLFGFEKDQTLEEILDNDGSRYLFRLCRLNQITPVFWHMFAAKYQTWSDDPQTIPIRCEYTLDDLHSHIDTDRRKLFSNPWLSTSLSFPWIVWRAIDWGRYEDDGPFVISVIDARHESLRGRMMLTVDGLRERGGDVNPDSELWRRPWSHQEVLVHGYIDKAAVVARTFWTRVKNLLVPEYLDYTPMYKDPVTFRSYCCHLRAALTDGWRPSAARDAVQLAIGLFRLRMACVPSNQADLDELRAHIINLAVALYFFPKRPHPESMDILKGVNGLREYQIPGLVDRDPYFGELVAVFNARHRRL